MRGSIYLPSWRGDGEEGVRKTSSLGQSELLKVHPSGRELAFSCQCRLDREREDGRSTHAARKLPKIIRDVRRRCRSAPPPDKTNNKDANSQCFFQPESRRFGVVVLELRVRMASEGMDNGEFKQAPLKRSGNHLHPV